jgi:hypothetical protein
LATTTRLPESLKHEADAYARSLGISLNALLAIALRDYLDARRPAEQPPAPPTRVPPADPAAAAALPASTLVPVKTVEPGAVRLAPQRSEPTEAELYALRMRPPLGARGLCGCGSGKRWNQCHGLVLFPRW